MGAHSVIKPHGFLVGVGPMGVQEADTLQCCHCNTAWVYQKGSGKLRGYCYKCMQVTCGKPECHECVPFEKRLELYEAGKRQTL